MKVAIVFEPDPDLGFDPLDQHQSVRRQGEFLDSERLDIFIAWREVGDQFEGGSRTHFIGAGIWENLSESQHEQLFAWLHSDGLPE